MSRTVGSRSLEDVNPEGLRLLLDAWAAAAGGGVVVPTAVPLERLVPVLPNMALADLSDTGATYRIFGPALVKLLGSDPTGCRIEDVYTSSIAAEVNQAFRAVAARRRPAFHIREFQILGFRAGYRRLILPLSEDGSTVTRIVVGIYPTSADLDDAEAWRRHVRALARENAFARREEDLWERFRAAAGQGPSDEAIRQPATGVESSQSPNAV